MFAGKHTIWKPYSQNASGNLCSYFPIIFIFVTYLKPIFPHYHEPNVVSYCNDWSQMNKGSLSIKKRDNQPFKCVKPFECKKMISYL